MKQTERARSLVVVMVLVLGTLVMAAQQQQEEQGGGLPDWPDESDWLNYTFKGERVRDWEDKPYETDPTHGPADVNPDAVDIASGVDATGGGPENNPGYYTSVQYLYVDPDGDSDNFTNVDDDWMFFRMRIADDPTHGGKYAYKAFHWDILLEVDLDEWKELVVDLNGGDGAFKFGTIGVFYNNSDTHRYNPDTDGIWEREASGRSNDYTRAVMIDYDNETDTDDQWWIEYRIPATAFQSDNGTQLLGKDTYFLLFFSTSASLTNPLQKDWMGEFVFGEPPNITVIKVAQEEVVSPGDTIHYTIHYNNTGDFISKYVWVNDTIPDGTAFESCYPDYDSMDGNVIRWFFEDVMPGNHSVMLNVTVDVDIGDGTILTNWVYLNYTDSTGGPLDESWDSVDVLVTGPTMEFSKSASSEYADPGDTITYTLTYSNTGAGTATEVTIVDTIPPETTFADSNPTYDVVSGDTYTWFIGTVPGYTTGHVYLNVTVDAYTADGTLLVNYATMDFKDVNGNPQDQLDDYANVTVTAPTMTISKAADVESADPGDTIVYTITYENTGTGTATDVVIEDTIPSHTTLVETDPAYDEIDGDTITWLLGDMSGGANGTITVTVTVDAQTPDETVLTNLVTLNYDDANGNPYPEESDNAIVIVSAPIVTFSKVADVDYADPGDTITYTLSYSNTGTGLATDVVVVDTIPAETTFMSSDPAYTSQDGDAYTWYIGDLSSGSSGTITIQVQVDVGTPDGTELVNYATLDHSDANGNPYPQLEDSATTTVTAPIMTVGKAADVGYADPGDQVVFTISFENIGSGWATNVVVEDTIPEHVTFISSDPTYTSVDGRTYTWEIGDVGPSSGGSITITVEVDAGTSDETVLTNYVLLQYQDNNGNQMPDEEDTASVTVTAPVMTFSKSVDVQYADPGDSITYTISYENVGTGVATDVVIVDIIPDFTTYVSSDPVYDQMSGQTLTWNVGTIQPNAGGTIALVVEVDAGTPDETVLTNTATLNYDDANGNPYPEMSDSASTTVTAPIMTLSKAADVQYADPGDSITYTITYHNGGTGIATDVTVVDRIPSQTTFQSASPSPDDEDGDVLTWFVGTVDPESGGAITVTVAVDAYTPDEAVLNNTVTLDYDDANGNPYDQLSDYALVTVTAPVMTVSKVANVQYADPGDTIMYTITYTNSGTGYATNVVIEDTIPPETTFQDSNPAYTSKSGDTYIWEIGTVAPATTGYIYINVTVDPGTPDETVLTNSVTLNYDDNNGNDQPEEEDSVDVIVTAPIMTVSKVADVTTADPGDLINYTISYENTGTGDATNVTIADTIPGETTFVDSNPDYTSQSGDVFTWEIGDVGAGESGSVTMTVQVDAGTPDGTVLTNTVVLSYDDANGNPLPDESDSVDVTVTAPIMTIAKSADVSTADPGDSITYTITYENTGSGQATDVEIKDTIPADTTFDSSNPSYDDVQGDTYVWNIGDVGPYSGGTITLVVAVDVGTPDGTVLTNGVTLDYSDANGNPYPQESDSVDVTVTAPVMTFSKSADVNSADPGDTIVYALSYENTGSGEATLVVVEDTIPSDVTFVSSDPSYDDVSGDTYTWNIGTVGAYSSGSITITVTVNVGVDDGTLLHNVATLDYADANGNYYPQLSDYADVTVTAPVMTFSKTADVTTADPGDTIVYTLDYENAGSGEATQVVVIDTIPSDVTFVSSDPSYDDVSGDTYTWNIGTVGAYSSGTITITVTVNVGVADGTLLHNTATLDYADANGNAYDQLSDHADVTVTAPIMTVQKSADVTTADPSDHITYTISYKNSGSGEATDVVMVDTIPAETTFISSDPDFDTQNGDSYTWNFASVPGGSSGTITIVVQVDAYTPDGTVLTNGVTLDYHDANGNPYPQELDTADVTVTAPVMSFSKTADVSEADPGDTIVYTLTYTNNGSGIATDVVVIDTIPSDVTFVSSDPSYDDVSGDTYTWNIGTVGAYSSGTITITVTVDAGTADGTLLHNTATLDYDDANGNPYPQLTDHADVTVTAPVLNVTKTADVSTADPDDEVTYTIVFENSGTGNATDVWINDTIPSDTTLVSTSPSYDFSNGDTYRWFYDLVEGGTTVTITIVVKVDVGTPDETLLHNYVTLDYSDDNGNPLARESAYADVVVTAPILSITKMADVSTADPGDTIVYTIDYDNSGTGWASGVYVNDTIPADTTFVSSNPGYTSNVGDLYVFLIGDVAPNGNGTITITVTVDVGTPDETLLHNVATLDYADANGNYYPQLSAYADVIVTAPILFLTKTADVSTADPGDTIVY
ncbi:MAG: hypothetical protein ACE5IJ_01230, partial [Thermoplasmata archaeon]